MGVPGDESDLKGVLKDKLAVVSTGSMSSRGQVPCKQLQEHLNTWHPRWVLGERVLSSVNCLQWSQRTNVKANRLSSSTLKVSSFGQGGGAAEGSTFPSMIQQHLEPGSGL
ncbi:hypothetical protein GDO78_006097 [Eleutherodactylus coqui]|uniref:Uncharacterized protein n=1 Tax=Eleutherodactylus coqui TaxID=57060 RepID=A0A8J6FPC6_ELECQ|nr:hypothetical protein GDO78_006097 [Eleutherodactylus coqui]